MSNRTSRGDKNLFCQYHQSTRHSTEVCWQLKDMIEKNVQNGELMHYMAGRERPLPQQDGDRARHLDQQPERDEHPQRVVDGISGGSVGRLTGKKR